MKTVPCSRADMTRPQFVAQARELHAELARLDGKAIASLMKISDKLAADIYTQIKSWQTEDELSPAALTFRGDIYSGLRAHDWDEAAQRYATQHLWILSGLYGILRPYDGIYPYRLEMGYKLRVAERSLYEYWNDALKNTVSPEKLYINITADEYLRAMKKSLGGARVITPKFLTISSKTGQPVFVTVHAKVARGAFANWMITNQVYDVGMLREFADLSYVYNDSLSTSDEPVFVCSVFGGLGLSMRLA